MSDDPHKVMTPEEYATTPIKGWHRVCRDVDGFGNVGIQYEEQWRRCGCAIGGYCKDHKDLCEYPPERNPNQ